jgi:hypothetical protein
MSDADGGSSARRAKLFAHAKRFGMSRDERIDLAEIVLRRDVGSWKSLSDREVERMLDVLEGAALVIHLLQQRDPRTRR